MTIQPIVEGHGDSRRGAGHEVTPWPPTGWTEEG